jgi:hypothetical protein
MAFGFWCFLLNVQLVVYFAHGFQVGYRWLLVLHPFVVPVAYL